MARNAWLQRTVPTWPFVRRAVRRFMPGERVEEAFDAADRLRGEGIGVLFTRLGEDLDTRTEADEVAAHYRRVLEQDADREHPDRPVELSVKPTQLGLDIDAATCLAHCHDLAQRCAQRGTWLWIDMEGSDHTDATVRLAEALMARHDNVGVALQAYLRRTASDIQRLLPLRPAIRLVKGAYDEPGTICYRSAADVDANFLALAVLLAGPAARDEVRLTLGTHDVELIEQIRTITEPMGVPVSALEVHMLYGIREDQLRRLRDAGHPVFSLVA